MGQQSSTETKVFRADSSASAVQSDSRSSEVCGFLAYRVYVNFLVFYIEIIDKEGGRRKNQGLFLVLCF